MKCWIRFFCTILFAPATAMAATPVLALHFHLPQTAAEETLDHIIRYAENGEVEADLMGESKRSTQKYQNMFTENLLKSLAVIQVCQTQEKCGIPALEGQIYGMDENPVSCQQDMDDLPYVYKTLYQDDSAAILIMHWQSQLASADGPLYKLVKTENSWHLDGIRCDEDLSFHW